MRPPRFIYRLNHIAVYEIIQDNLIKNIISQVDDKSNKKILFLLVISRLVSIVET